MPRTSSSQPRKGGSTPGKSGGGAARGKVTSTGRTVGGMMRGLSKSAGLSDLTRIAAEKAEKSARTAAAKAGKSASQVRSAARDARAESIKATAKRAGVSPTTARRWASGSQKPRAATEKAARGKQQRAMGGARGVQAAVVGGASKVNMGTVVVLVYGRTETRDMSRVEPSASALAEVADLLEAGQDAEAERVLGEALIEAYDDAGAGLVDFMEIADLPDPAEWT